MCYVLREAQVSAERGKRNGSELTLDEVCEIIRSIPRGGNIAFTGGEVFLRKWMIDAIEMAAKRLNVTIGTNAVLLDEEKSRRIVEAGVKAVGTSLDGPSQVHDAIRGVPGTFDKARQNIKELVRLRNAVEKLFPKVNFNAVILPENIDVLPQLVDIACDWGVDSCTVQVYDSSLHRSGMNLRDDILWNHNPLEDVMRIEPGKIEASLNSIVERGKERSVNLNFSPPLTIPEIKDYYCGRFDRANWTCSPPWSTLRISPYGDVFPCLNYSIGNVRETGLHKLWNNRRFRQFRKVFRAKGLFPACAGCCKMVRMER